MLEFSDFENPRIDLELYETLNYITPIDQVGIMDEDSFEGFISEWICACKKNLYKSIRKVGGAGDKGRDVICYYEDNAVDYYQCKHYQNPLTPSNYYLELGKLCYYTYTREIPMPKNYYIIASKDIGPSLQTLLDKPNDLKNSLLDNWNKCCKNKISKTLTIDLTPELTSFIENFDFSIIQTYSIVMIVSEYLNTPYGVIRFGGNKLEKPTTINPPTHIESEEMNYVKELFEAYSDELNINVDTIETLKIYDDFYKHFNRQRKNYYSAETIRRFVRDTLTSSHQFDILKEEIYEGIIDVHDAEYSSGFKRLNADLTQAVVVNTSKSLLDKKLNLIGNSERKGMCHILANEKILKWVKK